MCKHGRLACITRFYIGRWEIRKEKDWNVYCSYDTFNSGGSSFSLLETDKSFGNLKKKATGYKTEKREHLVNLHYFFL